MPDDLKGLIPPLTTEQRERMAWLMDEEATGYRMVWQKMGGNDGTCGGSPMSDERPPIRFKLSDGSSWPRPAMASDEYNGVGWKCRYSPDSLTREDLLQLASIADAYGYLLMETTRERRDFVCREARKWVQS